MKKVIRYFIGDENIRKIKLNRRMMVNYMADYKLYKRYSTLYNKSSLENKEADLILNYHSIEKGLLHDKIKPRFARYRVETLIKLLSDNSIRESISRSQIRVAFCVMCEYYELHLKLGVDIEDFFPKIEYQQFRTLLKDDYEESFEGALSFNKDEFYKHIESKFHDFSNSRKSIRHFTGEKIEVGRIQNAIALASNAPSVCNRQASKVYLIQNKDIIDKILKVQGGLNGYTDKIAQLLILTNDRRYYYTIGERNQFYIDGGVFLMNILYSLHYYKIANCPANWGKMINEEASVYKLLDISESEKIICVIAIGEAESKFRVTLSKRRPVEEFFIIK